MTRTIATVAAAAIVLGLTPGCGEVSWNNPSMPKEQADLQFYECKAEGRRLLAHGSRNLSLAINATTECLQVHGFVRTVR